MTRYANSRNQVFEVPPSKRAANFKTTTLMTLKTSTGELGLDVVTHGDNRAYVGTQTTKTCNSPSNEEPFPHGRGMWNCV